MKFSNEQLQTMIAEQPIGETYPYNTNDKEQIENYIQNLFYIISRSKSIKCEAIFDHYGSGYASYVDFFCYKKDGSSKINEKYIEKDSLTSIQLEGLVIYISRLAPVAIIGKDIRHKAIINTEEIQDEFFSGMSMISRPQEVINEPPPFMVEEFREIKQKLADAGYSILEKEYLSQPLPFKTKIQTFTDPRHYTVFDAFFYWMD
ncbi:hypothetical protein [Lysinibacillus antri]|uniref:Uncharacterized protein n=1 Tax=Lysinibacillus antri TaxID=2498145 RepID=A0A3S0R6Z0_9BACI|nr:hypothetical protein [Lysinibacillus antri]RUL54025.1 hypothetical protein EK386_07810 [Lysinibacillus antri]